MPKNKVLLIGILIAILVALTICASTLQFNQVSAQTSARDAIVEQPETTQSTSPTKEKSNPAASTEQSSNNAAPTDTPVQESSDADHGQPSAAVTEAQPVVQQVDPTEPTQRQSTEDSGNLSGTETPSQEPVDNTSPAVPDSTETAPSEASQAPEATQNPADNPEATAELTQEPATPNKGLQHASLFAAAVVNDPNISLGITCLPDLTARFVIFNNGGAMLSQGQYTVLDNGVSTSHSFQLAAGGSLSFIAGGNSHVDVTYSTSQLPTVSLSAQGNCIPVTSTPTNTSTRTSTATATGTATRTGTPTQTFTPGDTATNTNTPTVTNTRRPTRTPTITPTPTVTPTGTLTPTATNTRRPTRTPTPTFTPSNTSTSTSTSTATHTLTPTSTPSNTSTSTLTPTATFTGTLTSADPLLSLGVSCQADLTALFTIINLGGNMNTAGQYTVLTPTAQPPVAISLKQGGTVSFSGPGNATVELTYSTRSLPHLFLSVQGTCPTSFPATATNTPTNTPTHTSTPTSAPASTNTNTPTHTPVPANTSTPTPTNTATKRPPNPAPTNTPVPFALAAVGQCTGKATAYFTVTNNGGAMAQPQAYQITDASGKIMLTGRLQLAAGESTLIPVSASSGRVTLSSGNLNVSTQTDCGTTPLLVTSPTVSPTSANGCGESQTAGAGGFPTINLTSCAPDTAVVARPAWTPITIGGATCPDWLVYHTNMTGDWEIFRLGNLPDNVQADPNLSRGVGPRIFDIMPTTSPDRKWVAFTSNRDGNWEIYLSAVEENSIRRVTYNTTAIDLDPTWSPVGDTLIYESNRGGQWDLYRFNVNTGEETRLTDDPGNDVNAAWSNDGSRIAFESDREGFWQIYELDLTTLATRRLSDGIGDDHEPQYSNNGQTIVFRSYRDGNNSTIYTMDKNGGSVTRISDPAGDALNAAISPDNKLVAYQSNQAGKNSIYIYEMATGVTRTLTDAASEDYAPTWWCDSDVVVFTSDVTGDPNLFDASALPLQAKSLAVRQDASQLTFDTADDQYPESAPPEENASRQQSFPSSVKNK